MKSTFLKTMVMLLAITTAAEAQSVLKPTKEGKMEFPSTTANKTLEVKYQDGKLVEIQRVAKWSKNEQVMVELIGDIKIKRTEKGAILTSTKPMVFIPFQTGKVISIGNRIGWECNCSGCAWPTCSGGECCYPTVNDESPIARAGGGSLVITDEVADLKKLIAQTGGGIIITPDDVNVQLKNTTGRTVANIAGGGGGIVIIIDNF